MHRMHRGIAETKRSEEIKYKQQQERYNGQMTELRRQINHKDATNEEQLKTNERVRAALGMKGASTQIVRGRHVTGNESAGEVQLVVSQWTR